MKKCAGMEKNMSSFVKDIEPYLGTGEVNEEGLTLKEFLDAYDPRRYETPSNTVDMLVFSFNEETRAFRLLMIKRKNHPSIGYWALPGGFANMDEDLDVSAARELLEETGVSGIEFEQLKTYGEAYRDPRTRVITTAFVAIVDEALIRVEHSDDAADAAWFDISIDNLQAAVKDELKEMHYRITLENKERELFLEAEVVETFNRRGYLKNKKYKVINANGIAADHPAIITEGYLKVLEAVE